MTYNPLDNPVINVVSQRVFNAAKDVLGDKLDKVYLYGSYARGDHSQESDIDYMIVAKLPQAEACSKHLTISEKLGDTDLEFDVLVSCAVTGSETFYKFQEASVFYRSIIVEGVELNG